MGFGKCRCKFETITAARSNRVERDSGLETKAPGQGTNVTDALTEVSEKLNENINELDSLQSAWTSNTQMTHDNLDQDTWRSNAGHRAPDVFATSIKGANRNSLRTTL